jgi:hypothetical protein
MGKHEEKKHTFENLGVSGMMKAWSGFVWLRIGTGSRLL